MVLPIFIDQAEKEMKKKPNLLAHSSDSYLDTLRKLGDKAEWPTIWIYIFFFFSFSEIKSINC